MARRNLKKKSEVSCPIMQHELVTAPFILHLLFLAKKDLSLLFTHINAELNHEKEVAIVLLF